MEMSTKVFAELLIENHQGQEFNGVAGYNTFPVLRNNGEFEEVLNSVGGTIDYASNYQDGEEIDPDLNSLIRSLKRGDEVHTYFGMGELDCIYRLNTKTGRWSEVEE